MTLKEIELLEASPRLDALVAQHALGWEIDWSDEDYLKRRGAYSYKGADGKRRAVPLFSSDTLHGELIVQAIRDERDGHFTLFAFTTGWKALGDTPDLLLGGGKNGFPAGYVQLDRLNQASSRALAICRCALRTFILDDQGPSDAEIEEAQKSWDADMNF